MTALFDTLRSLGPARLAILGLVGAATLGFFVFLTGRVASPNMALLYGGLQAQDSGEIVSSLEQLKVPYDVTPDGSRILVPSDQVARLRLAMAEQGLPSGGSVGYEIFDRSEGFGTTRFVQDINHLRALEGELARSIAALGLVDKARVHLVLPRRQLFSREREQPSASIVLSLRGGELDRRQTLAIQHMVAAAVPGLNPGMVSIVDDRGALLAAGNDASGEASASSNAEDLRLTYERRLARTAESLIERSVGPGNVRVQVSADMDFDRITENSETYDPDGQVVRSTQTVEESSSNQDSEGPEPVTVGTNLPDTDLGADGQSNSQSQSQRVEETVNFEISRVVKTHVRESGVVRRLSVAILVNGATATNEAGEAVYTPRPQEELDQLAALARSAIGFDQERGDVLEIVNMPFADLDAGEAGSPIWDFFGLSQGTLLRIVELGVLGLVAILALLFVIRPLMGRLLESQAEEPVAALPGGVNPALAQGEAGAVQAIAAASTPAIEGPGGTLPTQAQESHAELERMIDLNMVEGRVRESSMKKIGEIVDKHPEEAVSIIRSWLFEQA